MGSGGAGGVEHWKPGWAVRKPANTGNPEGQCEECTQNAGNPDGQQVDISNVHYVFHDVPGHAWTACSHGGVGWCSLSPAGLAVWWDVGTQQMFSETEHAAGPGISEILMAKPLTLTHPILTQEGRTSSGSSDRRVPPRSRARAV
jgi:hypothetical protein